MKAAGGEEEVLPISTMQSIRESGGGSIVDSVTAEDGGVYSHNSPERRAAAAGAREPLLGQQEGRV